MCFNNIWGDQFKMNEIVHNFLVTEDKLVLELHLRQPVFTYSACETFTKCPEKIKKLKDIISL